MSGKRYFERVRVPRRSFLTAACLVLASPLFLAGCFGGQSDSTTTASSGTINFSNAVGTNANTNNITKTVAAHTATGSTVSGSLSNAGSAEDRVLNIQLGIGSIDETTVGKVFPIVPASQFAAGKARVTYTEPADQRFWDAQAGNVMVVAHDSTSNTLKVVDAEMTFQDNAASKVQPTGTFTINAQGKF